MGFQSYGGPNLGKFGTPTWENTMRGKVVASPKSKPCGESYESMFTHGSFVHQKCSNYALTNLLFSLCRSMWIIDLFVTILSPYPGALACPSTLKVLRTREHTPTPHSFVVFTLGSHLNLLRSFGVR